MPNKEPPVYMADLSKVWTLWPHTIPAFRRPHIKPVRGGRWFIRKCPPDWMAFLRPSNMDKPWKAWNNAQRNRSRWFETQKEAFEYAIGEVFAHAAKIEVKRDRNRRTRWDR